VRDRVRPARAEPALRVGFGDHAVAIPGLSPAGGGWPRRRFMDEGSRVDALVSAEAVAVPGVYGSHVEGIEAPVTVEPGGAGRFFPSYLRY